MRRRGSHHCQLSWWASQVVFDVVVWVWVRSPCDAGNAASVWVVHVPNLYSATHLQVPFLLFLNLLCHSLPPHGPTSMLLCSTWSNSSICCHQQFHTLLQLALSSCLPLGVWLRGFQALSLSRPPSQALFPPSQGSSSLPESGSLQPWFHGSWVWELYESLVFDQTRQPIHAAKSLFSILEVVIVSPNQLNWIKYYSKWYSIQ